MGVELDLSDPRAQKAIARFYRGNKVIGAGFLAPSGYVLTCAHVVRDALGWKNEDPPIGQKLQINFVYLGLGQKLDAEVLIYQLIKSEDQPSQDLAALKILDPLPGAIPPLNFSTKYSPQEPYKVLGFPDGHPQGIASYGQLVDALPLPGGWLQLEDTKNQGLAILPGFSGAPVWHHQTSEVMGMVVARDQKTPEAKIGFMIPAQILMACEEELYARDLGLILQPHVDELRDSFREAFKLTAPQGWEIPDELSDTIAKLQDAKQGDRPYTILDQFVAVLNLLDFNQAEGLKEKLEEWLKRRLHNEVQSLLDFSRELLPKTKTQFEQIHSHLLLYINHESKDERSVIALFVRDENNYDVHLGRGIKPLNSPKNEKYQEKVTIETLPNLVQDCVCEALKDSHAHLTVQLILPLAWLHEAYESWQYLSVPFIPKALNSIGVRCCCVLRVSERLIPQVWDAYKELWRHKWTKLIQIQGEGASNSFVPANDLSENQLASSLNSDEVVGFKISKVFEQSRYDQVFAILIGTGTAAGLWLRHDQFIASISPDDEIDKLLNCKMSLLPDRVKKYRSDAMAHEDKNAHVGHHLSLIWENPDLIPLSALKSMRMA